MGWWKLKICSRAQFYVTPLKRLVVKSMTSQKCLQNVLKGLAFINCNQHWQFHAIRIFWRKRQTCYFSSKIVMKKAQVLLNIIKMATVLKRNFWKNDNIWHPYCLLANCSKFHLDKFSTCNVFWLLKYSITKKFERHKTSKVSSCYIFSNLKLKPTKSKLDVISGHWHLTKACNGTWFDETSKKKFSNGTTKKQDYFSQGHEGRRRRFF